MRGLLALTLPALVLAAPLYGAASSRTARLVAAGDVASCSSDNDEATARLLDRLRGTVAVLGDAVYDRGTEEEFARCYHPSWGRHRARTRPAVGNHEYGTERAAGYFRYFGRRAGGPRGYYGYRLGAWHVVVLNSNCGEVGGCHAGSPQERWLRVELARRRTRCTLAYMHHPRFSSGPHGSESGLADLWKALARARADVVLAGHDHTYERFRRIDGMRQFVVGTGGKSHYRIERPLPRSAAHDDETFGVLVLDLRPRGYSWRFVPVAGASVRDAGWDVCR